MAGMWRARLPRAMCMHSACTRAFHAEARARTSRHAAPAGPRPMQHVRASVLLTDSSTCPLPPCPPPPPPCARQDLLRAASSYEAKIRNAVNLFRNRLLTMAFSAWMDAVASALQRKRKVLARVANGLLARTFAAWVAQVAHLKQVKSTVRGVSHRMANRALYLTFNAWKDYCADKRTAMGSVVANWANAAVASAWRKWSGAAAEWRRLQDVGGRMIRRYRNALLAKCFLAWIRGTRSSTKGKSRTRRWMMAQLSGRSDMCAPNHLRRTPTRMPTYSAAHLPTCPPAHLPTSPPAHLPTCPPAHRCVATSAGTRPSASTCGASGPRASTRGASRSPPSFTADTHTRRSSSASWRGRVSPRPSSS